MWCILENFNSVCSSIERDNVGSPALTSRRLKYVDFSSFVSQVELIDLPLLGIKFIWFQPKVESGGSSRIESILISNGC